ncbi:MAG: hypothetical protein JW841_05990 [Deltaproteobacteria bacterium]|nr:hypothetical protein [Deltaproteobacteria bacterium]
MVSVQHLAYGGWPNCYRVSDGEVEIIAVTDIGPRIIRCGLVGGTNLFFERVTDKGRTGGNKFRYYGGHRLWCAPESKALTYNPDNQLVHCEELINGVLLRQVIESSTGIEKSIQITLDSVNHIFSLIHCITNKGSQPITISPWALTMLYPGGVAIVPQYRQGDDEGYLPNRTMALWPYTDMNDARVTWGADYTLVRQNPNAGDKRFKFGVTLPQGWLAYLNQGVLFIKTFEFVHGASYPDNGVNSEVYTVGDFLELESFAPLCELAVGAKAMHGEQWSLVRVHEQLDDEASVWPLIGKHIKKALGL